jgi:hypothetical protein
VRCTRGAMFDVAVDLCQWFGTELDDESGRMLYISEGCGRGYQTLDPNTDSRRRRRGIADQAATTACSSISFRK